MRALVRPGEAGRVGHVPQVGTGAQRHLDAVTVVVQAALLMHIGHLQVAGDHFLIVLETAAGQHDAAVDLDLDIGAFLVDDHADHDAVGIGDQLLAGGGEPHVNVVRLDGVLAEVEIAAVKARAGGGQAQAVLAGRDLRELIPVVVPVIGPADLVGINQAAVGAVRLLPRGVVGFHAGRGMLDRRDQRRIAAHRADHPAVVLRAALAVRHDRLRVPVLELAHQRGQVLVQALSIIGRHDELTGDGGVAALSALGRLLREQNLDALLAGSHGRVRAGAAVAQNHNVILRIPLDAILLLSKRGHAHHACANRAGRACRHALEKSSAGNLVHTRILLVISLTVQAAFLLKLYSEYGCLSIRNAV